MSKIDLTKRWTVANIKVVNDIMESIQNNQEFRCKSSPFGFIEGKIDFRGIDADQTRMRKCVFEDTDFSFSSFQSARIEDIKFVRCHFYKVNFSNFSEHGNHFNACTFIDCKFNYGILGYGGTHFVSTVFEKCNFTKSDFIRAEFVGSIFKDCRMKGIDFNASSFDDCIFEGELSDVWFRGGFALPSEYEYYGLPKKNEMKNVSFEKAELKYLTFSDNCDLSSVRIKNDGKHYKYDRWGKRLEFLKSAIGNWEEEERKEAEIFADVHLVHAKNQQWYIINREDEEISYGKELAIKIIDQLNRFV